MEIEIPIGDGILLVEGWLDYGPRRNVEKGGIVPGTMGEH